MEYRRFLIHIIFFVVILSVMPAWSGTTYYADASRPDDSGLGTNWDTAKKTIQAAVDLASGGVGDVVLVTNGVYNGGGTNYPGDGLTNRVMISKNMTLRTVSSNSADTIIVGAADPSTTNGPAAIRGVYLGSSATLIGFTITNGHTLASGTAAEIRGAGVYCESQSEILSNCVAAGNYAADRGGGTYYGTLYNCVVHANRSDSYGGGSYGAGMTDATVCRLYDCVVSNNVTKTAGAGLMYGRIENSVITKNTFRFSNDALVGGGMAYMTLVKNCVISGNTTREGGGGAYRVDKFVNCLIKDNRVTVLGKGGGIYGWTPCLVLNCTVVSNKVHGWPDNNGGGGLYNCIATNTIIYYNIETRGAGGNTTNNFRACTLAYCNTTPTNWVGGYLPGADGLTGPGHVTNAPQFVDIADGDYYLQSSSPCIDAGTNLAEVTDDIEGKYRPNDGDGSGNAQYDIGCYEYGSLRGRFDVSPQSGHRLDPFLFTSSVSGTNLTGVCYYWDFDNDGSFDKQGESESATSWTYSSAGTYRARLVVSNTVGETHTSYRSLSVGSIHYVWTSSPSEASPYDTWDKAAHTIQEAVDEASAGAMVLVTNGTYNTGGTNYGGGSLTNRVVIDKAITVEAVSSNPADTIIVGGSHNGTNGPSAIRCVYMTNGPTLRGFMITNGHTLVSGSVSETCGGGVFCASQSEIVTNCVIAGNHAGSYGGGTYYGTLYDCVIRGNLSDDRGGGCAGEDDESGETCRLYGCVVSNNFSRGYGSGVAYGRIEDCLITKNSFWDSGDPTVGGGVFCPTLVKNSVISANISRNGGAGGYAGEYVNCLIKDNRITILGYGGGIYGVGPSRVVNCTIVNNTSHGFTDGNKGGGIYGCAATNCIIWGNIDDWGDDHTNNYRNCTLAYCCTTPTNWVTTGTGDVLTGTGHVTNNPAFSDYAGGDFHLSKGSPCVDAGTDIAGLTDDLDSEPRPRDGNGNRNAQYDMGCYESPSRMGAFFMIR